MKLFIDSADPKEIADCAAAGLMDGVTTEGPLTDKGLAAFLEDAKRAGAKLKAE